MPESILTQAAVLGVKTEYEAMGEDLYAIQMRYIKNSRNTDGADGTAYYAGSSMRGLLCPRGWQQPLDMI